MKYNKILLFLLLTTSWMTSCQKSTCEGAVKATIKDATGTDGCGILIQLQNGDHLEPRNLEELGFDANNGQKVWVSYHLDPNGVSICMVGDPVEIDCIEKR